jgi:DNA-binding Lrp family transcriptional regulator
VAVARTATRQAAALDAVDHRILEELQADGRLSMNELAARVRISRATAYQRVERLRRDGVITGFTAVIDHARAGLALAAFILVNVEQHSWREARAKLHQLPGLHHLALTTGGFDFALLVRVPDVETLRDVVLDRLQGMPEVRSTQTVFVLDEDGRHRATPPA